MDKIPSWLYYPIAKEGSKEKWSPEKQELAERIMKKLREHAKFYRKDIDFLEYNRFDDNKCYGVNSKM